MLADKSSFNLLLFISLVVIFITRNFIAWHHLKVSTQGCKPFYFLLVDLFLSSHHARYHQSARHFTDVHMRQVITATNGPNKFLCIEN